MSLPRSRRRWAAWAWRGLAGATVLGIGTVAHQAGLSTAEQVSSCVGAVAGVLALGAPFLFPPGTADVPPGTADAVAGAPPAAASPGPLPPVVAGLALVEHSGPALVDGHGSASSGVSGASPGGSFAVRHSGKASVGDGDSNTGISFAPGEPG
jgi:hypothetical protein